MAQGTVPQIADGAGWQTEVVIASVTTNPVTVLLSCNQDTTQGATQNWNPFPGINSNQTFTVSPGSTVFLHTQGTAPTLPKVGAVSEAWV